jgi:glycosyltransferase involved in cell wall biosynthesis
MIPVYNRTQYLEKTLRSVLSQDPGPEEMQIEVVDDASTVEDPEPLVRRIAGDRVSSYRNPQNLGLMPNFNNCIERSRGEWVQILHTDDFVLPGFYERLKSRLESRFDVGAAFCRHTHVDENERRTWTSEIESPTAGILPDFIAKIGAMQRIVFASIVVRRSVYERWGGFRLDLPYAADWEMWIRIAAHYPIWYEPKMLAVWRVHSKAASEADHSSGKAFIDLRRCIEISRAWLPLDRAETIARSAKEWVYLWELAETSKDDAALGLVDELINISRPGTIRAAIVADAFLRAAHIHYRHGRRLQALVSVARAVVTRPIVAGRPVKRAVNFLFSKIPVSARSRVKASHINKYDNTGGAGRSGGSKVEQEPRAPAESAPEG